MVAIFKNDVSVFGMSIKKLLFPIFSLLVIFANPSHAIEISKLRHQAENGNMHAQYDLAVHYATGDQVSENAKKAAKWFLQAAKQGHVDAQVNLAVWYAMGLGVEQNQQKALEWYHRAAAQGNGQAQYNLAARYHKGLGIKQDDVRAKALFKSSCSNGFKASCQALQLINNGEL
jgi:TPR repeat protein